MDKIRCTLYAANSRLLLSGFQLILLNMNIKPDLFLLQIYYLLLPIFTFQSRCPYLW